MKEIMVSMVDFFRENRRDIGKGLELLPGVRNLLETLSGHPDVVFGLVSLREQTSSSFHRQSVDLHIIWEDLK
jgi:hypothetical protein